MDIVEKVFAHLSDLANRVSRNKKQSFHSLWAYATMAPSVLINGLRQLIPSSEDWEAFGMSHGPQSRSSSASIFRKARKTKHFALPEVKLFVESNYHKPSDKFGKAGHAGQRDAVAGVAYLIYDAPSLWANWHHSWAGCLLQNGGLFTNTTTGDVYHSLGFHVCSAVGCRVKVFVVDGAEFVAVHPWEGSGPEILHNFTITEEEPEWVRLQVKLLPHACLGHRRG